MRLSVGILLFGLLLDHVLCAQRYNFINYGMPEGMPQSDGRSIMQDSRGFLWFGTQKGPCYFDGVRFGNFTVKDGLSSNVIYVVFEDSKGQMWFGSNDGVSRYQYKALLPGSFVNYNSRQGLVSDFVTAIGEDAYGHLLVGTNKGLSLLQDSVFTNIDLGVGEVSIRSFFPDSDGRIWIATSVGAFIYESASHSPTLFEPLRSNYVEQIRKDKRGRYWFATREGLYQYAADGLLVFNTSNGLPENRIEALLIDRDDDAVWVGIEGHGLIRLAGRKFSYYDRRQGLTNNAVISLCQDSEGNIWVGGRNGISMFNKRNPFTHYVSADYGVPDGNFFGMVEDSDKNVWVSSYGNGILRFGKDGSFRQFTPKDGIGDNRFFAAIRDRNNHLWFSTANAGITRFNSSSFQNFNEKNGFANCRAFTLLEDSRGTIWIATQVFGLAYYRDGQFGFLTTTDGLPANSVMGLCEDKRGRLWVGSITAGLSVYDGSRFVNYGEAQGLQPKYIRSIKTDAKGNIFLGSSSHGVIRVVEAGGDSLQFQYLGEKDGLASENVYVMNFDSRGHLWVGTEKGIDRIIFNDDYTIQSIRNYGSEEGFIGIETDINGFLEASDKRLWFGTIIGATLYHPERDAPNTIPPRLHLTNIKLFFGEQEWLPYAENPSGELSSGIGLKLPYESNHLSFSFVGISLSNPKKVKYRYILEGLDREWSPVSNSREAVYTNIPPGKYTFKVMACNEENIWTSEPLSFTFDVTPPWWQGAIFQVSVALLLVFMLYGGVKWRLRNLEAAKTLLQRKVRERTEEIRRQKEEIQEQASDIALKNQILEQQKFEIEQQHTIVKATYQQLTDSIRYARQLQNSIFGSMSQLASCFTPPVFEGAFVYTEPRDIVSGDFCWYSQVGDLKMLAAVDCTGHGVPGAFMTLLGNNFLQDIVNRRQITEPAQVLAELDKRVIESFGTSPDSDYLPNDGMDIVLLAINEKKRYVRFAAAKTPLYLVRNGGVTEYKGSRYPIGSMQYTQPKHYEVYELSLEAGDVIYLCSDGFQSQFGGERQRKYLSRRFKSFLLTISEMSPAIQEAALRRELNTWKGNGTQTDDVLVIGLKCL